LLLLLFLIYFLSKQSSILVDEVSLPFGLAILYMSFEHRPILESNCHFLTLIDFSFYESSDILFIANFENAASLRLIVKPLTIIVKVTLVLAESMTHSLLEFTNINILSRHKLSLPFIKIVLEVANVLMDCICKFTIAFFGSILKFTLVKLIFIQIETALRKSIILDLANI
jgi:hypothetical protein